MSEAAPEQQAEPTVEAQAAEPESFSREYVEELRKEAAKYRTKANENSDAAKAAEKARIAAMSETERAIEEARQSARAEATAAFGTRLAQTEVRAQAADAGADLAGVFDFLDLKRFVNEDGEPDAKAIKAFVDALPKKVPATGGLDLGARTTAPAGGDMNQALRRALGRS